jgi:5'-nucleotidase
VSERAFNDLSDARILVTNDDGIHAPGIKVLEKVAKSLSQDVWVVAPEFEQSGASHSLTLTQPLRVRKVSARKFAVRGTPTDCVLMACSRLIPGPPPDLVLSGVNRGANLAEDVSYSGTVSAAKEATLVDIPAIALSQCLMGNPDPRWQTAAHFAPDLIRKLCRTGWRKGVLININFPDVDPDKVKGVQVCRTGKRNLSDLEMEERIDARGIPYYWMGFRRQEGPAEHDTDLAAIENGYVAVTPLQLDHTDRTSLKTVQAALTT